MHKILKELDSHFIVELPNGATIKIAKGGLSSHMKEKVMFMAEGGMVPDKGFIPDTSGPVPGEVVPINVLPKTPPEARFTGVTRATPEEQMQAAKFAPGTADIYKTAVDQPRPVKQAPIQPYMPEQAPGGAEEAPISPLDFPMEAASLAGAGAKGLVRGAMAGREAIYKAIPSLANEVGSVGSVGKPALEHLEKLGYKFKINPNSHPSKMDIIVENPKGDDIGVFNFDVNEKNKTLKPLFTNVDEEYRSKGIASAAYHLAQEEAKIAKNKIFKVIKGYPQSEKAKSLWNKIENKVDTFPYNEIPQDVKIPKQHLPEVDVGEKDYNYRLNYLNDVTYAVKGNKVIGHLGVDDNNSVKAVFVDKPERNKGIAEQLYTNYVNKNGILKSDDPNSMEQSAINLWEKLQKKYPNEITKTNSGYIWEKPKTVAPKIKQQYTPRINPLGMYSKLEQTIAEKMGGSATPEQIKGMLRDVKPEEMQYSGLNDFLQGKDKVSKQEVLDFVKANELPVQEKVIGANITEVPKGYKLYEHPEQSNFEPKFRFQIKDSEGRIAGLGETKEEALADFSKANSKTKFSQYTLPGGENYREKLYTLPARNNFTLKETSTGYDIVDQNGKVESSWYKSQKNDAEQAVRWANRFKQGENSYLSSHWNEPNVLAHTRLNDRIDDEGRKHLFVEEIQSDWHQAGRKQGYKGDINPKYINEDSITNIQDKENKFVISFKMPNGEEVEQAIYKTKYDKDKKENLFTGITQEEAKKQAIKLVNDAQKYHATYENMNKVPDAPMKKTWHEFVSKNLLSDAAKGGYDNISWTTGAQQNERYNLSKFINDIEYKKSVKNKYDPKTGKIIDSEPTYSILARDKQGHSERGLMPNMSEQDLEEMLGKEMAKKIVESATDKKQVLSGADLEVGGEGMKGFYDKMIPDYMAKIGKKYGVKPEKTVLSGAKNNYKIIEERAGSQLPFGVVDNNGNVIKVYKTKEEANNFINKQNVGEVWTMKITPEMRKDILEKGLPLYAMGGVVAGGTLNSKEAGAKDMNYKMLENNKDHYIMKHPDGSSFKVAKKGLNPEIMKKIEGYADFVQRAEGQIPGVDMPEQNASYMPEQPKEPDFAQMAQQAPRTKEDDYARRINQATGDIYRGLESTYGARMGMIPEEYTPEKVRSMAEEQVLGQAEREAVKAKNQAYLAKQDEERSRQDVMAYNERAAKVGMPLRPIPGEKQELPLEAQAKQVEQPQAPEPQMAAQKYVDPFALYEKGIRGESAAKAEYAQQEAETYKKLQEDMNNGNKMFNDKLAKLYEQGDALKKAAESKNIDPNRYWSNLGTANKIGASISMILGSLGGALSGTDNVALKIIDKTIDNDIEAQKKNIDQANNLYRTNLEAVKNEQEAYNITKAQMIGNAEQVLKQKLATATSKEAIAQGQMALAKMQLAKQELLQKSAVDTVVQAAQSNPKLLTPEIVEKLPADQRERAVPGYGIALSKPGAEKMRMEIVPQMESSVQMINDLMNLRQKYGREITNRDVVNEANTLRAFLRGQMRTFLVGPGAVTESEQKILDSVIADPTKILSTDSGTMAALQSLKTSIQKSFANQARANGLVAPQVQAQSQQPVRGADGKFYIKQGRYMVPVTK